MSEKATSDAGSGTNGSNGSAGPQFSEREQEIMRYAWRSLKSGPPEIDYDQLAKLVGMTNPRSASNAWAKIKAKLMVDNPEGAASPAKPKATPKKKAAKKGVNGEANGDDGGDVPETPKKTPRKRAPKKQEVDGEAGSPSPKKKGRPAKAKKSESVVADTDADADAAIKVEANGMFDEDSPKEDNAAADAIDETPDEV